MYKAKPEGEGSRELRVKVDRDVKEKKPAIRYPFWFGGSASSMAACVTHPLDLGM
jgi:dicarboxylate transporter 10